MASGILMKMKEEATCPICLELLTEPLSLDCGHSFCQACLTANNMEPMVSKEGESSCPVCRIAYQPGNLRPNWHLANIVEMLREVKLSPEEEQKTDLCEHHGEKLLLFCKEDGKFICWLCERSQEHRGHHTFLVEEIAQEYQNKLQAALDKLREKEQEAEKLEADIREERIFWENQMQNESHSVQDCFKKLRGILDNKEQKELQMLEKEKRIILHALEQSESEQVEQSQVLKDLISELEHRLQVPVMKMLQQQHGDALTWALDPMPASAMQASELFDDVNGIMKRSHTFTLKKPKTVSRKQRRVFQVPDLNGMLQVFDELTAVRCYWVHITLDRPYNRQSLAISEDQRQVRYKDPDYSDVSYGYRFKSDNRHQDNYGVLGSPFFTSGKHYWEVDVSEKNAWILGVCCQKSPNFNLFYDHDEVSNGRKVVCFPYENTSSQNGYWVIGSRERFECKAFSESSSSNPLKLTIYLTVPPCRVGIFLDCKARTVSFYNITNHGFLIYKFSSCSFSQKIHPYFNPMQCTHPITLCSPSS